MQEPCGVVEAKALDESPVLHRTLTFTQSHIYNQVFKVITPRHAHKGLLPLGRGWKPMDPGEKQLSDLLVEPSPWDWEVARLIPSRVVAKTPKMVPCFFATLSSWFGLGGWITQWLWVTQWFYVKRRGLISHPYRCDKKKKNQWDLSHEMPTQKGPQKGVDPFMLDLCTKSDEEFSALLCGGYQTAPTCTQTEHTHTHALTRTHTCAPL